MLTTKEKLKLTLDGLTYWRTAFKKETCIFRKASILRAIADVSTNATEQDDILKLCKGLPEESNIMWSITRKKARL